MIILGNNDTLDQIIDDLSGKIMDIKTRVQNKKNISFNTKNKFNDLYFQINELNQTVFQSDSLSKGLDKKLDQIIDTLSSIADLNFSVEAVVEEEMDIFDYIAFSINMMRERLEDQMNSLKFANAAFNSFKEMFLITDEKGIIQYCNNSLNKEFALEKKNLIGIDIKAFFKLSIVKNKYRIEYANTFACHYLDQNNTGKMDAKSTLRISGNFYPNDKGNEMGICYKMEVIEEYENDVHKTDPV